MNEESDEEGEGENYLFEWPENIPCEQSAYDSSDDELENE